jgi:hypothetical protein
MGFPKPTRRRGRLYWDEAELDAWDQAIAGRDYAADLAVEREKLQKRRACGGTQRGSAKPPRRSWRGLSAMTTELPTRPDARLRERQPGEVCTATNALAVMEIPSIGPLSGWG